MLEYIYRLFWNDTLEIPMLKPSHTPFTINIK